MGVVKSLNYQKCNTESSKSKNISTETLEKHLLKTKMH